MAAMGQIVCVLGNKGGTGKTTLSHMLGQGLGLLGVRAVVAVTDATREPLVRQGRRYLPADARRPQEPKRIASAMRGVAGWVGVIDGGAGRLDFDLELAVLADLVLLPFRESQEDVRVVLQDLERMPRAMALPSQWPTNPWAREAAQRSLQELLSRYPRRVLAPVSALGASKLLLQRELPPSLPSALESACRELAQRVAAQAGIALAGAAVRIARQGPPVGRGAGIGVSDDRAPKAEACRA